MTRRLALLIGNSTFNNTDSFPNLRTPANDVGDFARVLQQYGGFEILDRLVDATFDAINQRIEQLFSEAEQGDLVLLYYSGHGYRDADGRHYLIAANTQPNLPQSTGIRESFIHDVIGNSRSRQRVVILDCCFSGTFIEGRKSGATGSLLVEELKGEVEAILASSGPIQDSFEGKDRNSLFTKFLLEGIKTGKADQNEDGQISVDELFNYAEQKVRTIRPEQKPIQELNNSKIHIAKNPEKKHYHLGNIRTLLTEGFFEDELRDFCYDTPEFSPVYRKLPQNPSQDDIIDKLIEYASQRLLFDALLDWAKTQNSAQYDEHKPYFDFVPDTLDFSETQTAEGLSQPKVKPSSQATRIPTFIPKPIFISTMASIAIIALIVISTAFRPSLFNFLFKATPVPGPAPKIVVEVLEQDFGPDGTNRPREGKPIPVGPRAHTVGHTEFVQSYGKHVWLFVCKRQGDISCGILPLSDNKWEEFVYIGDPSSQDECAIFEVSFVIVDDEQNSQLQDLPQSTREMKIPSDILPAGLDRARFEIRRELNENEDFISC